MYWLLAASALTVAWFFLLGVFIGMLIGYWAFRMLPHQAGWRTIEFNDQWTDARKRWVINEHARQHLVGEHEAIREPPLVWRWPERPDWQRRRQRIRLWYGGLDR